MHQRFGKEDGMGKYMLKLSAHAGTWSYRYN